MANYFLNENFKISKGQNKSIKYKLKILKIRIIITKLKDTFLNQSLINAILYCQYFSVLNF